MSEKTNKHDRENTKRAVAKRHEQPQGEAKFPDKRMNESRAHGGEPTTSNNPRDAEQTGVHTPKHGH